MYKLRVVRATDPQKPAMINDQIIGNGTKAETLEAMRRLGPISHIKKITEPGARVYIVIPSAKN